MTTDKTENQLVLRLAVPKNEKNHRRVLIQNERAIPYFDRCKHAIKMVARLRIMTFELLS